MVTAGLTRQARALYRFTVDYLTALGAALSMEEGGLLRVELSPDHMAELEGRTGSRMGFFGLAEEESVVLYLAFSPSACEMHPNAELVAPGNHRLEQMLASARRRGRVARFTLLAPDATFHESQLYEPYILFHFRVSLEGKGNRQQLMAVCVNLVDGSLNPDIATAAKTGLLLNAVPVRVQERRLGFLTAWEIACEYVIDSLRHQDDGWARESLLALAQEKRILERFYSESEDHDRINRERRLAELEQRTRPRAVARTPLSAVLFVPTEDP